MLEILRLFIEVIKLTGQDYCKRKGSSGKLYKTSDTSEGHLFYSVLWM